MKLRNIIDLLKADRVYFYNTDDAEEVIAIMYDNNISDIEKFFRQKGCKSISMGRKCNICYVMDVE